MKTKSTLMSLALVAILSTGLVACSGESSPLASLSSTSFITSEGVMESDIAKASSYVIENMLKGEVDNLDDVAFLDQRFEAYFAQDPEKFKQVKARIRQMRKETSDSMRRVQSSGFVLDSGVKKEDKSIIQGFRLNTKDGKSIHGSVTWDEFGVKGYAESAVTIDR